MAEVTMPRLSDTMAEGTIAEWIKKEGDKVEKGDVLLEIETDKATMTQESYEAGVLEQILVKAGQTVPIGTVIAVIGSGEGGAGKAPAPAEAGAPAPVSGQAPGTAVNPSGSISASDEAPAPSMAPGQTAPSPKQESTGRASGSPAAGGTGRAEGERVKASPLAKRMAAEYGIPLENIKGTGPGGRIISDDVKEASNGAAQSSPTVKTPVEPTAAPAWGGAAVPSSSPAPAPATAQTGGIPAQSAGGQPTATPAQSGADYEERDLSRMRLTIARRLTEAKQQIPHIYISNEIDMGEAMKLRQTINGTIEKDGGFKVSVNDMVIKAAAIALRKFPAINSSFMDTKLRVNKRINISLAVALEDGLITPVIKDADQKSIGQIARESKSLIEKARTNKLRPDEYQGGTFSVSNLGMYDVTDFVAVINPPNAGILAVGSVKPTPVVTGHTDAESYTEVSVAQIMKVTISVDHRATDGAVAAQFLQELKRILQNPMSLLI